MNNATIPELLRQADINYQKAIAFDTNKKYADALVEYNKAKQIYESVYEFKNDVEAARLKLIESNLQSIYNRLNQLSIILQNYQQTAQFMYPQVPLPPASYAGTQNYPQYYNCMPQDPPLYEQLPLLSKIKNMINNILPQTSYPQYNSAMMQQNANAYPQQQCYYHQGQAPYQIQPQNQAQLYNQQQQNLQQNQPESQSNPQPSHDDHQKSDKSKNFHFFKKKDKDDDEDKDSSKEKKHDKNEQLHTQDQKPTMLQQQNINHYPNRQQQQIWQQPQMNSPVSQMQPQFASQHHQIIPPMMQQQYPQIYPPLQPCQAPQPYQINYPQIQQFGQQQAPSREISVDPRVQNQNNLQEQSNSDSVSYDSGDDCDKEKTGTSRKRAHHVLISDQIIQPKDYFIKRDLGKGSNGKVYLVSDVHTGKEYAMKELLHQLISSEEQKSFFREIELMMNANHPAVLKLIGFSMTNLENKNSPILILELMPNGSLQDVIEKKKNFTLTQKYIALYGIAEAMKYLHSKGIVHRDLKPANVLLNQFDEPAVADFGLSKFMNKEQMRQTQAAGSPVYMAPELMMRKDYNNSIDVYAYGYICYELLLEELSFNNITNIYDLVNRVCNGVRPPLDGKNLDEKWIFLISRCWDSNPFERPTFHQICQLFIEREIPFNDIDMNRFSQYELKIKTKK